jgi:AraC-like DNA-binding protein
MPFAPKIRKDILKALEEHIISALETQRVTQVLAESPFDFSQVEHRILQKKFLEDKEPAPFQTVVDWKKQRVMATRFSRFMIIFEGLCIERVGITQKMAQQLSTADRKMLGGLFELTLHAPAILCHPAFMLYSSGAPQPKPFVHRGCAIYCKIVQGGIRVSLNVRSPQEEYATHNLEINDSELAQIANLYIAELQAGGLESAQSLLLAFMLRLKRYMSHHRAFISNSCWVTPPDVVPEVAKVLSPANLQRCQQLTEHIVNHLHSPLTLSGLAAHFHVSDVHLNAIFKQAHGTTVMNFVTQMRIEAAKTIIAESQERFADVAQLVGFASNASFCNSFRRQTGLSPREYRQQFSGGG